MWVGSRSTQPRDQEDVSTCLRRRPSLTVPFLSGRERVSSWRTSRSVLPSSSEDPGIPWKVQRPNRKDPGHLLLKVSSPVQPDQKRVSTVPESRVPPRLVYGNRGPTYCLRTGRPEGPRPPEPRPRWLSERNHLLGSRSPLVPEVQTRTFMERDPDIDEDEGLEYSCRGV